MLSTMATRGRFQAQRSFYAHHSSHVRSSPLRVSYGGTSTDIGKQFLATVGQVDPSRPGDDTRDATDFHQVNVYNVSLF